MFLPYKHSHSWCIFSSSLINGFLFDLLQFVLVFPSTGEPKTGHNVPDAVWIEGNNHFLHHWGYFVLGASFSSFLRISWGFCYLISPACWETSQQYLNCPAYQSIPIYRNASIDLLELHYIPFSWSSASAWNSIVAGVDPPKKCTSHSLPVDVKLLPTTLWASGSPNRGSCFAGGQLWHLSFSGCQELVLTTL